MKLLIIKKTLFLLIHTQTHYYLPWIIIGQYTAKTILPYSTVVNRVNFNNFFTEHNNYNFSYILFICFKNN